jgi:hypothetical protein
MRLIACKSGISPKIEIFMSVAVLLNGS